MRTLTLTPPAREPRSSSIVIGDGASKELSSVVKINAFDRVVILFDEGIEQIAKTIAASIGSPILISVLSGDASKSLLEVERITAQMLKEGCTRKTLLVCIGGGMLTDLGGFVASVFMRGISCVLVPTTLLGMVDAAIGGKTAVNAGGRKNMAGTITHPHAILVDTALLTDLPDAQFAEGMVEVVKIAAMVDRPFFEWLEATIGAVMQRKPLEVSECVTRAIEAKVRIVENDEHDRDERLLLNFGHTVGHAVESLSKYALSHGAAVSIGMAAELRMKKIRDTDRILALLKTLGMPQSIPAAMGADALWTAMLSDKKNEAGAVRVAVPVSIGEGAVQTVTKDEFLSLFP